jgi:hypothetical protein
MTVLPRAAARPTRSEALVLGILRALEASVDRRAARRADAAGTSAYRRAIDESARDRAAAVRVGILPR